MENGGEVVGVTSNLLPQDTCNQACRGTRVQSVSPNTLVAEPRYRNPSLLVWLICHANEATGCGRRVVDNGTGGNWVPYLCPHQMVLHRIWVENPSTRGLMHLGGTGGVPILSKGTWRG